MLLFPNAKINIGLQIIEKREDSFHNLESCFYPVNWCDALEVIPSNEFEFTSSGLEIHGDEASNLCVKAYKLVESASPKLEAQNSKLTSKIHLHKVIPMGAGLGGGSADGAFVLKALNEIYDLRTGGVPLTIYDLQNFARKLGSDCAFFIENKPVFCYEKGDKFEEISLSLKGKFIVLVNPAVHISTAEAYAGVMPKMPEISLKESLKLPITAWKGIIKNDFEEKILVNYPIIAEIKEKLYDFGAVYASMTGSGSTVYGIFENEIDLKKTFKNFAMWQGFLN